MSLEPRTPAAVTPLSVAAVARAAWLAVPLLLPGCLKNEEEIEVRADGSIEVVVRAKGNGQDLTDGYPVPFGGSWQPLDDVTRAWVSGIGPATGGAGIDPAAVDGPWTLREPDDEIELAVGAVFANAQEWPVSFAAETEPYATAYTVRRADLQVHSRGGRQVYVFERTFERRPYPGESFFDQLQAEVERHASLKEKLEKLDDAGQLAAMSESDWRKLAVVVRTGYRAHISTFTRYALEGLYTEGAAELDPAQVASVVEAVAEHGNALLTAESLQRIAAEVAVLDQRESAGEDVNVGAPLEALDRQLRGQARAKLMERLEREGVPLRARHGVAARLEWCYTASDHEDDLSDEEFAIAVRMPGQIVSGNFDALDDGAATWSFEGEVLLGGDVRMRVVSVL